MNCPNCGGECWRDEVDIGVGTMHGPWRCDGCDWYEGHDGDQYEINDERDSQSD
jgi:hypothetical protein